MNGAFVINNGARQDSRLYLHREMLLIVLATFNNRIFRVSIRSNRTRKSMLERNESVDFFEPDEISDDVPRTFALLIAR